jgi:hypothetical protein
MWVDEVVRRRPEGPVVVRGFLLAQSGRPVFLCHELLESYPPQCGRTSLVVEGIDLKSIPGLQEAGGVLWSAQPVEIEGTMRRGVLYVAPGGSHP